MISQTAAQTPKVAADGPELYQGDTEARPRPDPRASKIRLAAAIANAPAMIAGHDTPETALSTAPPCGMKTRSSRVEMVALCMIVSARAVSATAATTR